MGSTHQLLLLLAAIAQGATSFMVTSSPRSHALRNPKRPTNRKHPSKISMSIDPLITFVSEQLHVPLLTSISTFPSLSEVQVAGESALAASVAIAAAQGAIISHQYATNPAGELVSPPGPTFGKEDASLALLQERGEATGRCLFDSENTVAENKAKEGWYHINKWLVFLTPMVATPIGALLRFEHLAHLAVILALAHIYDFFRKLPTVQETNTDFPAFGKQPHIVVLGDSMSVGIGCVNEFDPSKDSGILRRVEQLEPAVGEGPAFPRTLAQSLSRHLGRAVSWRSAGVDGGDTSQIRDYLLPVVQQEVDNNKSPDVVVVLTGSNDLKHLLGSGASIRGFRANMLQLASDVRAISPGTKVVFPALPTYRLDSNSILNVFPLNLFLDGIIGFWDAQKIQAASVSDAVFYVDLKVKDVREWYQQAETLLAADGIHPNKNCYEKWARHVGDRLVEQLLPLREETEQRFQAVNMARRQVWSNAN